jgi:hypothetical protein
MNRIYKRFRFTLIAFALGLAAVYMTNGLRIAWEAVPVKLPEARSDNVLVVSPVTAADIGPLARCRGASGPDDDGWVRKKIFDGRDMHLYEGGGHHDGSGYDPRDELWRVEASLRSAREFIWSHWQQKKRGYVVVSMSSVDAGSDAHIFIEPDQNGNWQVTWYWEHIYGMASCPGDVDKKMSPIRSVKFKRATRDDWDFEPGTTFLKMTNEDGDDFSL